MLPSCPELGLRRGIRGLRVCLVSNRFRKYYLGLSTSSSDQRGLSRDIHQHELMAAGGVMRVHAAYMHTCTHICVFACVCMCADTHMCGSGSSATGLWVQMVPLTRGAELCVAPGNHQPCARSGVPGGNPEHRRQKHLPRNTHEGCSSLPCAAARYWQLPPASINDIHPISHCELCLAPRISKRNHHPEA